MASGHLTVMVSTGEDPIAGANEADVVEQRQEADGTGTVGDGPDVTPDQADEADALEQGAHLTADSDEDYPHQADEGSSVDGSSVDS